MGLYVVSGVVSVPLLVRARTRAQALRYVANVVLSARPVDAAGAYELAKRGVALRGAEDYPVPQEEIGLPADEAQGGGT